VWPGQHAPPQPQSTGEFGWAMASMSVTTTRPPRVVAARFTFCIERLGRWGAFLYCNNDIVAACNCFPLKHL
jgi:hypothetical protein